MKIAAKELKPVIKEAYCMIKIVKKDNRGSSPKVTPEQKAMILLLKTIFQLSNRKMANFLFFFTMLTGIDITYKTVERTYSDPLVQMIIHNMFMIMVKRKEITGVDLSGDGTGYSLTITKHYRTERTKELKKKTEKKQKKTRSKSKKKRKKLFVRSVALMDLDTKMYVGYGTSMK
ncbi:MAG: ISNCY family transposase, partial [Bacteroidetes bacterium]|nr:ISNCY family transposase [Bacteroidota bacterium]